MGILTSILFVILGFYLLGWIGRLFLQYWIGKQQQKFGQAGGFSRTYSWGTGSNRKQSSKPEGNITVQQTQPQEKKINRNVGDYVDYEEISDSGKTT